MEQRQELKRLITKVKKLDKKVDKIEGKVGARVTSRRFGKLRKRVGELEDLEEDTRGALETLIMGKKDVTDEYTK